VQLFAGPAQSTTAAAKFIFPRAVAKSNCVLVNPKQRGNPLLKTITAVPWEYDDIIPDYVVGLKACILYLSLRYHTLNPDYINQVKDTFPSLPELEA
jgi:DNA excision repair protein ERCC-1